VEHRPPVPGPGRRHRAEHGEHAAAGTGHPHGPVHRPPAGEAHSQPQQHERRPGQRVEPGQPVAGERDAVRVVGVDLQRDAVARPEVAARGPGGDLDLDLLTGDRVAVDDRDVGAPPGPVGHPAVDPQGGLGVPAVGAGVADAGGGD
jgi:hypothetical protein